MSRPARLRLPWATTGTVLIVVAVTLVVIASVALSSAPASADPAQPTDYRARILSTSPALPDGVELSVVGGDSFLEMQVEPGHTAVVPDYAQRQGVTPPPYLRFRSEGTVERNERSIAAAINRSRYGTNRITSDASDPPRWTVVARDGRYLWHDHRIHWMVPDRPKATSAGGRVDMGGPDGTWTIELSVDGSPMTVTGELVLLPAPSPVPWYALIAATAVVVLVGAGLMVRAHRRAPHRYLAGALGAGSILALATGLAQWRAIPPGAGGTMLPAAVPAIALVASIVALVARRARVRLVALAAAIAALGGWAWVRRQVLSRAVLPTSLPFTVDRATTALTLGLAAAGAVILVWHPPTDRSGATTSPSGGTAGTAAAPPPA